MREVKSNLPEKIFNINKSYGNDQLFFGEDPGLFDSINVKYPDLDGMYRKIKAADWDRDEWDYRQDNIDFKTVDKSLYESMLFNLIYQTAADSVASRAIFPVLAQVISNSELLAAMQALSYQEVLHSDAYAFAIRNCFDDPQGVIKETEKLIEAHNRLEVIANVFEEARVTSFEYALGKRGVDDTYPHIMNMMVALFSLEAIQFINSFAITGAFYEASLFKNVGAMVKRICIDEQCVTGDHEVLTPSGWKRFDILSDSDEVAQWDYGTGEISFTVPEKVIRKKYTGEVYTIGDNARNISQIVTKDHRIPVINPRYDSPKNPEFVFAQDLKRSGTRCIPNSGHKIGETTQLSAEDKFWIAYQADGTFSSDASRNGKFTNCKAAIFQFKRERKIFRLEEILNTLGWEFSKNLEKNGFTLFYVKIPLDHLRTSPKDFGWIDYSNVDSNWAEGFIQELVHWDGSNKGYTGKSVVFSNNNLKAIEVVQTLAHLCGYRGKMGVTEAHTRMSNGAEINAKTHYRVNMYKSGYVSGLTLKISKSEVQDLDVFCVRVPTSYFLVRHNGIISVTGNCHAELDKMVIKHELKTERGKKWLKDHNGTIKNILDEVVASEREWTKFIFSDGRSVPALNEELVNEYINFISQNVYKTLNIPYDWKTVREIPLPYMLRYADLSNDQASPQEQSERGGGSYLLNAVVNDADDFDMEI